MDERRPPAKKGKQIEPHPNTGAPVQLPEFPPDTNPTKVPLDIWLEGDEDDVTEESGPLETPFFALDEHLKPSYYSEEGEITDVDVKDLKSLEEVEELNIDEIDTVTGVGVELHAVVNQLKAIELFRPQTEQEQVRVIEAARYTSVEAIRLNIELNLGVVELQKQIAGQSFDSAVVDRLKATFQFSDSELSGVVQAAQTVLAERAAAIVQQQESARLTKTEIAKKVLGYATIGVIGSIATGGLGSIAALTIGRFTENIIKGKQRDQAIIDERAKQMAALAEPTSSTARQFNIELVALLAERKQRQLDKNSTAADSQAVLLRLQELYAADAVKLRQVRQADLNAALNAEKHDSVTIHMANHDLGVAESALQEESYALGLPELAEHVEMAMMLEQKQQAREQAQVSRLGKFADVAQQVKDRLVEQGGSATEYNITTALFAMAGAAATAVPGVRRAMSAITGYRLGAMLERKTAAKTVDVDQLLNDAGNASSVDARLLALELAKERILKVPNLSTNERHHFNQRVKVLEEQLIVDGRIKLAQIEQSAKVASQIFSAESKAKLGRQVLARMAGAATGFFATDLLHLIHHGDDSIHQAEPATLQHADTGETGTVDAGHREVPSAVTASVELPETEWSKEILSHSIRAEAGHDSISAVTRGDVSESQWLATIQHTKIPFPDGAVKLWDTATQSGIGVRADAHLAAQITTNEHGDPVMHFYDTQTLKEIPLEEVHHYVYRIEGVHLELPAVEVIEDAAFRAPDLAQETATSYVEHGLRHFVETHPDYGPFSILPDEQLTHQPLLQAELQRLQEAYRQALVDQAQHAQQLDEYVISPESVVTSTQQAEEIILPSNGYQEFVHSVRQALTEEGRHKLVSQGLVITERGGQLYVDAAGGLRRQGVALTEQLYQALMAAAQEHPINQSVFNEVVRRVEEAQ